jgi:YD repeat-containing protein
MLSTMAAAILACSTVAPRRGPERSTELATSATGPRLCAHGERRPREPRVIESRSSATTAVGKTVNELDATGRVVVTKIDLDGDGQIEQTVTRRYDGARRLVEVQDDERTQRFVHDRDGRVVARETEARGRAVDHTELAYDDHGRVARELGDLDDVRYVHDPAGCIIREQHFHPGDDASPYIDLASMCDSAGHRVSLKGEGGAGRVDETWRYDDHGNLVEHAVSHDGSLQLVTRVSYDSAGRRIAEEYRNAAGTLTGDRVFTYDSEGNVSTDQTDDLVEHRWTRNSYFYDAARSGCGAGSPHRGGKAAEIAGEQADACVR